MSEAVTPPTPAASGSRRRGANPVLRRELLERWRGRRATWILTGYVATLTVVMLLLLWAGSQWADDGGAFGVVTDPSPVIGRFLFDNVLALVLLLVLFVGPGYAAAQIAQERERRTLGLLQITLVSPWRIVAGKLGAAAAWLLLLVLTSAPMAAVAFFLGGVELDQLVRSVTYLLLLTVSVAAIGIGVSSMTRRTVAAVVLTYAIVLGMVVGTGFVGLMQVAVTRGDVDRPVAMFANPFTGLADAADSPRNSDLPSILTPFAWMVELESSGPFVDFRTAPAMPMGGFEGDVMIEPGPGRLPGAVLADDLVGGGDGGGESSWTWLWIGLGYLAAGGAAAGVATLRVRPGHGPKGAEA